MFGSRSSRSPRLQQGTARQEALLMLVTIVWAGTLFIVQEAMQTCGPLFFVGLRFITAAMCVALVFRRAMVGWTVKDGLAGAAVGTTIFLAYALQSSGLKTISGSQSAFITSMYVPCVPLLQWLLMGQAPHAMTWLGIGLAFAGLVMLSNPDPGHLMGPGLGEVFTLLGALAITVEIVLISRFAPRVNLQRFTVIQLLVAGVLSWLAMPVVSEAPPAFSWFWLISALGMGVLSAIIQLAMNWAQKDVSPTRATLIYASGPIWGGAIGLLLGEHLSMLAVGGALLITVGMVLSEWRPRVGMANSPALPPTRR